MSEMKADRVYAWEDRAIALGCLATIVCLAISVVAFTVAALWFLAFRLWGAQ